MPKNHSLFEQVFRSVVGETLHCAPEQPQCISQMILGTFNHLSSLTLFSKVDPVDELKLLTIMGKQQILWRRQQPLERQYVLVHSIRCHFVFESSAFRTGLLINSEKAGKGYIHYVSKIC